MVYGHYDVQPPEPLDLWKSPPFEPRIAGRSLFARGSTDNKGQHFAHLESRRSLFENRHSPALRFDVRHRRRGRSRQRKPREISQNAPRANWSATPSSFPTPACPSPKHPALTYSLRGIIAFEITLHGPSRDLHSGVFGGAVDNPAMALSQLLGKLRDKNGRIAIPGFYDDVTPLSAYERKEFARLPITDARTAKTDSA